MLTNTFAFSKGFLIRRVLVTGLILFLGIALTTGSVWIQTDQCVAPPALRLMDELWRLFICRCIPFGDPFHLM